MPGFVGIIGPLASEACTYQEASSRQSLVSDAAVSITVEARNTTVAESVCADSVRDGQISVAIYGHCIGRTEVGTVRQLDAKAFLALWRRVGPACLDNLEGAFQIAVVDRQRDKAWLMNDRLGGLPLYMTRISASLLFACRVQALPAAPGDFAPDPSGVVAFLSCGYCLGSRTLYAGVEALEPATLLEIDLKSFSLSRRRYWNLVYEPDREISSKKLISELGDAINESVAQMVPVESGAARAHGVGLFLSGGWDCRGLLGAMRELGRSPAIVVTNGVSDERPDADTGLARRIASDLNIPYRFCRREPELSSRHCVEGISRCELRTDTCPEVFGQHRVSAEIFSGVFAMLKGDEIWGWGDLAMTRSQAIGNVMPTCLSPALKGILAGELAAESDELYEAEIERVLAGCENDSWNDRKDYLYLYGRVARYIFGLGASDEEHIQVRRPFLTRRVLDVVSRMPDEARVQKNLYLQLLKRRYPELFGYGRNHRSHIADYYSHMAEFVRRRAMERLAAGESLGGLLNSSACQRLLTGFVSRWAADSPVTWRHRVRNAFGDRYRHVWHSSAPYRHLTFRDAKEWSVSDRVLAFRVFLLLELFGSAR